MATHEDMLRSVAAVLASRGAYGPREREMLAWLGERWGVERAAFDRCLAEAARGENVVVPEGGLAERREWFLALAAAASEDGVITAQEWTVLRVAAERLGLRRDDLAECLETTLRGQGEQAPAPAPPALRTTVPAGAWPGPILSQEPPPGVTEESVPGEWRPGDVFLELYEVKAILGQGGVGTVYRVHHIEWDFDLAVKSPRADFLNVPEAQEHLVREAETWVNLGLHPHVVPCYYVRMLGGLPRIFAEYIDGGSLAEAIRSRALYAGGPDAALARILDTAIQFAWGLDHAHEQGLVHGDVKPANVLVNRQGLVKVTDFGLAKAIGKPGHARTGGAPEVTSGMTPAYCSPEQAEGTELTIASDVWSWAVSLLEMFAGEVTWHRGHQADDALQKYLGRGPMDHALPEMPRAMADLLFRCLRTDPSQRPADMQEIVKELRYVHGRVTGRPYGRPEPKPAFHLADGLNNRAVSLLDLARNEEAQVLLDLALDSDPHHIHATYHRGLLLWRTGRLRDDALVRSLREVQTSQTRTWEDELLLGWVHVERGDREAAEGLWNETARLAGDDAHATRAIAQARAALDGPSYRCRRTMAGHAGSVHAVALMPEGGIAISAGWDRTLRVWNVATGACLGVLEGHAHYVNAVALTQDGRWAVSAGADGALRVWDVPLRRCLRELKGEGDPLHAIALGGDGRHALAGGAGPNVSLWDVASGKLVRRWASEAGAVNALALTRDGRRALAACADGTVREWEVGTGTLVQTLAGHDRPVAAVAWTEDGDLALSAGADRTVRVWNVASGKCLRVLDGHSDGVAGVGLSTGGMRAISAGGDRTLRVWEVPTGRCLRTLEGHAGAVKGVALAPDGRLALSVGDDGTVRAWDLPLETPWAPARIVRPQRSEEIAERRERHARELAEAHAAFERGDVAAGVTRLAAARAIAGFERAPAALALCEQAARGAARGAFAGAWALTVLPTAAADATALSVTPDGRRAASAAQDGRLCLWNLAEERLERSWPAQRAGASGVALDADGRRALSVGAWDEPRLWDAEEGRAARALEGAQAEIADGAAAMTSDGRLGAACGGARLDVWRLADGKRLRSLQCDGAVLGGLALTADGTRALTGTMTGEVLAWDLAEGRCVRTLPGHARPVTAVALTPCGRVAASASLDGTVRIWDLERGACAKVLAGHAGAVPAVALSADGRIALSGGADQTLRLWNAETGDCLRTLEGHLGPVTGVGLAADLRRAMSVSRDRTLRVWRLDWELAAREAADWDEGARPYLEAFLAQRTPVGADGLTRRGRPSWSADDFGALLEDLARAGFGWLRTDGVRAELGRMAGNGH